MNFRKHVTSHLETGKKLNCKAFVNLHKDKPVEEVLEPSVKPYNK